MTPATQGSRPGSGVYTFACGLKGRQIDSSGLRREYIQLNAGLKGR
jgi:hypothetical protein